ncbi:uncharacterized protein isoform X2 [Musca autumnalis]|uniref:uncharacterized protein isoform X2 n=1 Tax=Musca autumnalis TaxID=221902 RepID=UPI003CECDE03
MGSLNGDVVVMRNGRSTSQVSIYNYPEHLNPFYEDDQHKRLRFWKISKKGGEGRRNSFSIGNLRDMWSFKSFSLKKKSSTLGINKTSESPPPLRKEFHVDNGWNSFDHRLRGSTTSSINGDSFQRNATYRSSLQTLPSTNERFGFNRNDDYRSTIQVPRANPRYHPQQQKPQVQPRRSSQSSTVSTNPFESDIDDDNEDGNTMISVNGGSTSTISKATPRKKRRAPAPPTPSRTKSDKTVNPTIVIDASQDDLPNDELCIREDMDIANLTAEIENFVNNTNNDDVEPIIKKENKFDDKSSSSTGGNITTETHNDKNSVIQTTTTVISTTTTYPKPEPEPRNSKNCKDDVTKDEIKTTASIEDQKMALPNDTEKPLDETGNKGISNQKNVDETKAAQDKTKATTVSSGDVPTASVSSTKQTVDVEVTTSKTSEVKPSKIPDVSSPKKQTVELEVTTKETNEAELPKENVTISQTTNITAKPINGQVVHLAENEKKVVVSNGAIPKKSQNSTSTQAESVTLKIEETQVTPQKPLPAQRRASKTETEVGHVECIHVHVESPRATPREPHPSKVTSFKNENEVITTKTPFVLTSPPSQRKATESTALTKETTKLMESPKSTVSNDLKIQEEPIKTKSEVMEKPAVSPKPAVNRTVQGHNFAEIHKPSRNVHARRPSRDEVVTPPSVPHHQQEEQRQSLQKTVVDSSTHATEIPTERQENTRMESQTNTIDLKIEEPQTKDHRNEIKTTNLQFSSTIASTSMPTTNPTDESAATESAQFDSLYRPRSQMEWKRSTLAPLETNIPPEKRKSVKDIIESINRSQRLLQAAANKDFTIVTGPPQTTTTFTNVDNTNENIRIIDESQRDIRRSVNQMENLSNGSMPSSSSPPPSYSECIAAQKLDNNEIFQKCKVKKEVYDYRESSPISSNLDWNPVPKPKRTTKPQNE